MTARSGDDSGWFDGLADEADRFVRGRLVRLAAAASEQTDRLAEHAAEGLARHLVDQIVERLAARLAWGAATLIVLMIGLGLLVVGLAGALGELFGRAWLGDLAAGGVLLAAMLAVRGVAAVRKRRRAEWKATTQAMEAARAAELADDRDQAAGDDAEPGEDDFAARLGRQAVQAGSDLLRRHPVAGAAALGAAGFLAGKLLARAHRDTDD